ncbi:MAG: response regulator [Salinivirgaceae bacterium]|nr:response regulator [Salinivirgaceae bacterium]MDD4745982.1 response regulator [Salinivirgaceae bacterium]
MGNRTKILYVDDELINLQLFDLNFNKSYNVLMADNGFTGLEMLESNTNISVVISDMKMPNMNGLEFIKRAKEKHPQKRYCIMTGFDMTDEIREALVNGLIVKYFRKPYNKNEILVALDELI